METVVQTISGDDVWAFCLPFQFKVHISTNIFY
jgi:hypothetical protein